MQSLIVVTLKVCNNFYEIRFARVLPICPNVCNVFAYTACSLHGIYVM